MRRRFLNSDIVAASSATYQSYGLSSANDALVQLAYNQHWSSHEDYLTKAECSRVSNDQLLAANAKMREYGLQTFNEFQYFTSIATIKAETFAACSQLTEITLPETVTWIDAYAFQSAGITSIVLPKNVSTIRPYAFRYSQLTSVTFTNTDCHTIGESAFQMAHQLTTLQFAEGVTITELEEGAFAYCYAFDAAEYFVEEGEDNSNGLQVLSTIGRMAFYNTITSREFVSQSNNEYIHFPDSNEDYTVPTRLDGCVAIGDFAIRNIVDHTLYIPSSIETICDQAIKGCHTIVFKVDDINSVSFADNGAIINNIAFEKNGAIECTELNALVVLGSGYAYTVNHIITSDDTGTWFVVAKNLERVTVPTGVDYIGAKAICGKSTKNVILNNDLQQLKTYSLYSAPVASLSYLDENNQLVEGAIPPNCSIEGLLSVSSEWSSQVVGTKVINGISYKTLFVANKKRIGEYVIDEEENIEVIGEWSFMGARCTKVVIPNSVKMVERAAFQDCVSLKYLSVGTGITNLGLWITMNTPSLRYLIMQQGDPTAYNYDSSSSSIDSSAKIFEVNDATRICVPDEEALSAYRAHWYWGNGDNRPLLVQVTDDVTNLDTQDYTASDADATSYAAKTYIQNTSDSYAQTQETLHTTRYTLYLRFSLQSLENAYLFGAKGADATQRMDIYIQDSCLYMPWVSGSNEPIAKSSALSEDTIYTLRITAGEAMLTNEATSATETITSEGGTQGEWMPCSYAIGTCNYEGTPQDSAAKATIYSATLILDEGLDTEYKAREYVAAYSNEQEAYGYFDTCGRVFYPSASSPFTGE